MALTKARLVHGDGKLASAINEQIAATLGRKRDPNTLRQDVIDMRDRLDEAKGERNPLSLKAIRGGLTDIAFINQFLLLKASIANPPRNLRDGLVWCRDHELLSRADAECLVNAHDLFEAIVQFSRASNGGVLTAERIGEGAKERINGFCDVNSFQAALEHLINIQGAVTTVYRKVFSA